MSEQNQNRESRFFGYKDVTPEEKTGLVRGVFESVADRYDIMNDVMSGGIHRLWKDRFVRRIRPASSNSYLDVAGGTGDIAFRIREKAGPGTDITVVDLTENMLEAGRDRAVDKGWLTDFDWVAGNAESLPVQSESRDVYTIAFGLRNVTRIDTALSEACRVLKPGGRFFCLEFSQVKNPLLAEAYIAYSKYIIPNIGAAVAGDRESYKYLIESIARFPDQKQLAQRIENAGFTNVSYTNLSSGIAAIHQGWKI